jgi:exopolyphosphatase/guanosine-5'-triphosphate,3'-diphosphate pyrophosphatase
LYRERRYVKLAAGGLDHLDEERIERAVDCMTAFAETARAYQVSAIRATGTSAMREAGNGADLARRIHAACGIPIEIIDGQAEAGYILKGIRAALPPTDRPALVMDIGGGSVEFILYRGPDIRFKASYRIGVAVLFRAYHREDPLTPTDRLEMEEMLGETLAPLFDALRAAGPYDLVGASGSFEIIHAVRPHLQTAPHWAEIDLSGLPEYLESIIRLDTTARQRLPDIPIERVDYVVVAFVLIQFVLRQLRPERLFYCEYALKEGVMAEMAKADI